MTMVASLTLLPALLGFAGERVEVTRWRGLIAAGLVAVALRRRRPRRCRPRCSSACRWRPSSLVASFVFAPLRQQVPRPAPKPRQRDAGLPLEPVHPAPPVASRRSPAPSCCSSLATPRARPAPRLLRRGQLRRGHHHPQGLRPAGRGLRPRLQRPAHARRRAARRAPPRPTLQRGHRRRRRRPGRGRSPRPAIPNNREAPTAALWRVVPTTAPQDEATTALGRPAARQTCCPRPTAGTGLDVAVTGAVAIQVDFSDYLADRLPLFFGAVLGAVVPAADDRLPLGAGAAQGGGDEPAVDRRRLRRRRRRLPVGLAERLARRRGGARSSRSCR